MNKKTILSVIIPCYKCAKNLNELYQRLVLTIEQITKDFEIIFVNDASPDKDWEIIKTLAEQDKRIVGINLSRNFGQHYAITAGIDFCKGSWVVVMDGDLQDQPEEILKLYEKVSEGYDIVVGKRTNRKDNFLKRFTSKLFYIIFNYLTDQNLDNKVANFGIYSRQVIESVKELKEKDRSFGLLVIIVGYKRAEIEIEHAQRKIGKSSYSFKKRLNMALDHILSHSNKPLILTIQIGFIISLFSFFYAVWLILRLFLYSNIPDGWTSLIVSVFFLSGLIIMFIGIVGVYIGKIYNEVKKRPLYFIKEITK